MLVYPVFRDEATVTTFQLVIELEGTDELAYSDEQYAALVEVTKVLMEHYPGITLGRITGHNDIAPKRKTDPGVSFNWPYYRQQLCNRIRNEDVK